MKDLYNNIDPVALLDPIAVSTTQTITNIDLAGAGSAVILIHVGIDASMNAESHNIVFTLSHSDVAGSFSNKLVETKDMLNLEVTSGIVMTLDNVETEDNTLTKLGYVGGKRYLQLVGTVKGTTDPPISIILLKGNLLDKPPIAA